MAIDLNLLPVFLAVAQEPNFRAAADRLGVTRSAVSQGIKRLEDMVGLSLVRRTTRSVRLTEAGIKLHDLLSRPWTDITTGLEQLASEREPKGLLRLAVTSIELVETEFEARGTGRNDGKRTGQKKDDSVPVAEPVDPTLVEATSLSEVIGLYLLK